MGALIAPAPVCSILEYVSWEGQRLEPPLNPARKTGVALIRKWSLFPPLAPDLWLRDFAQGKGQDIKTKNSNSSQRNWLHLEQSVMKFKPQDALKNKEDFGGMQVRGGQQFYHSNKLNCRLSSLPERTKERHSSEVPPGVRTNLKGWPLKIPPVKGPKFNWIRLGSNFCTEHPEDN